MVAIVMALLHREFSLSIYFPCKNYCQRVIETTERSGNHAKKHYMTKSWKQFMNTKKLKRNRGEKGEEMKME